MKPQIFISHFSKETNYAIPIKEWIYSVLIGGVEMFVSTDNGESIPLGSEWFRQIKSSLEKSSIILVVVSHQSKNREWLYFETGAGYIKDIPVIPICIGGLKKNELPTPLNFFQAIELPNENNEKQLIKLIAKSAKLEPKIIHRLDLPKEKILTINENNILNNEIAINNIKEDFYISQTYIRVIDFFKTTINQNNQFTITEIEKGIKKEGERKRKFIIIVLKKLTEQKIIKNIKEDKSYWRLTNEGLKNILKIK